MFGNSVLELKLAPPAYHLPVAAGLFLLVVAALLITPLRWPYTTAVLLFALGVLWRVWCEEEGRARFEALKMYLDDSLVLVTRDGSEIQAVGHRQPWVSPWLIVLSLALPDRGTIRVVITRELNDADAFRRFTVLCRHGFSAIKFAVSDAERHNEHRSPNHRSLM